MSLVIKFGDFTDPNQSNRGMVYLDAVTAYGKNYSGKVTSHPMENGASISDHFISENPKFRISGVISGADISPYPSMLTIGGEKVLNSNPQPPKAIVNNLATSIRRLIPDSIEQFIPNLTPQIIGGGPRHDFKEEVEALFETVMSSLYYNEQRKRSENRMTLITLYETEGSSLGRSIPNLVMTNYSVQESPDSGDALFLEVSFEQVRFATLAKADAPAPAKGSPTAKAASTTKDKGPTTATKVSPENSPGDAPFSTVVSPSIGSVNP